MPQFDLQLFMAAVRREAGETCHEPLKIRDLLALLRLEGRPFLYASYQRVLFRAPDPVGLAGYAKSSHTFFGRLRTLLALLCSTERAALPRPLAHFFWHLKQLHKKS
ncbi:MAG: hypothetical protein IJU76_08470 [Desulfovibrionaceae bacterium]|nr:hypothetical protein [Desulfovibrionaceae bacterium]